MNKRLTARPGYSYFYKMLKANTVVGLILLLLMIPLCMLFLKEDERKQNIQVEAALQNMLEGLQEELIYLRDVFSQSTVNESINRLSVICGSIKPSDAAVSYTHLVWE